MMWLLQRHQIIRTAKILYLDLLSLPPLPVLPRPKTQTWLYKLLLSYNQITSQKLMISFSLGKFQKIILKLQLFF